MPDGCRQPEGAIAKRKGLNHLLGKACTCLRKWRSNSQALLQTIPEELKEQENLLTIPAPGQCHKALGLHWNTAADTLHVATPQLEDNSSSTKRQVASDLARTFDILGWFAPSTVNAKAVMQRLWQLGLNWDEQVPPDIEDIWKTWRNQLPFLTRHPMPRCYFQPSKSVFSIQLHGFSDASKVAYAGVVYVRAVYQDATMSVRLMLAKSQIH